MLNYILRRCVTMAWTLLIISILIFAIINLPDGNYLTNQIRELMVTGEEASIAKAEFLLKQYALDEPLWKQYLIWIGLWSGPEGFSGIIQGNFGYSFELDRPVNEIVAESMWFTIGLNLVVVLFVYMTALPLGALAAVRANTWIDYLTSFIGYLGLATPNFLLALVLMYYGNNLSSFKFFPLLFCLSYKLLTFYLFFYIF